MSVRIGINGFGRIGRLMFRQAVQDPANKFKIMAINDSKDIKYLMYLLKYDSVHGKYVAKKSENSTRDCAVPFRYNPCSQDIRQQER